MFQGERRNATDACEEYDPCQHEGICISTDTGPICECRNNDYEGTFCEKGIVTLVCYLVFFFGLTVILTCANIMQIFSPSTSPPRFLRFCLLTKKSIFFTLQMLVGKVRLFLNAGGFLFTCNMRRVTSIHKLRSTFLGSLVFLITFFVKKNQIFLSYEIDTSSSPSCPFPPFITFQCIEPSHSLSILSGILMASTSYYRC